jgi:hypothetical protein
MNADPRKTDGELKSPNCTGFMNNVSFSDRRSSALIRG